MRAQLHPALTWHGSADALKLNSIHRKLVDSSRDQSMKVKALQILSSSTNVYSTISCFSLLLYSFSLSATSFPQVKDFHSFGFNSAKVNIRHILNMDL